MRVDDLKIIICLDEQNGYMFIHRRQSMDRLLRQRLLSLLDGKRLWMSEYTKRQFSEEGNFSVDDEYEKKAAPDDFCFIEDKGYDISRCDEIWIFRWNRKYPYDKMFDEDLEKEGFRLDETQTFVGSSHEEIGLEIYKK